MRRSLFFAIVAVLFVATATFTSCSDEDDDALYFTVYPEQITAGAIAVNEVHACVDYYTSVDVRGYKGEVKAVSADESIATVEVNVPTSSESGECSLSIMGKSEGTTVITATDGAGRTGKLTVMVSKLKSVTYRRLDVSTDEVVVEGVTDEEAAAIRKDVLDGPACGDIYLLKEESSFLGGHRLLIYKKITESQTNITTWFGGPYNSETSTATNLYRFYMDGDINGYEYSTDFIFDVNDDGDGYIKILLTDKYKATYPNVANVMLVVGVAAEQGENVRL